MRDHAPVGILIRLVLNAVAVWVATLLVGGVDVTAGTTGGEVLTFIVVGAIFGLVNATIKPLAKLLSLPLLILSLGLFALVLNALLFWLTAEVSGAVGAPFEVDGFWPAFWGAIVVSLVSWALSIVVKDPDD
ncbi:MAG: putative membrane protein [uncultured Corynebacteriales bacterium]|jgi:putative membrane protein|uniref:Putative membrane protein n=1 Tax=uncultured Mycobacteriales bacterium TaxID=581187 RepID=A0A6J4ILZ8_9ACTN|nr:MAG: putative membrane protein [uncultured Corynebacteriales bacterium]